MLSLPLSDFSGFTPAWDACSPQVTLSVESAFFGRPQVGLMTLLLCHPMNSSSWMERHGLQELSTWPALI